jgi:hypothetical protein
MDVAEIDRLELGSVPIVVYAGMLGATVAGQLLGIAVDALVDSRVLWIPAAFSVVLEAAVGARFGAARAGKALDAARSGRVSVTYSVALLALSLPLGAWIVASRPVSVGHAWSAASAAIALAAMAVLAAVRWGLMVVFAPRRP